MRRRDFLRGLTGVSLAPLVGCRPEWLPGGGERRAAGVELTDVHSRLNPTRVARVVRPDTLEQLVGVVRRTRESGEGLSVAGGRHSMGGQQFATGRLHVDGRGLNRILALDRERGRVRVESGIQWPELMAGLEQLQAGEPRPWAIVQKQTGADWFTLAGSLSANGHGRGLDRAPLAADVESLDLVGPDGELRTLSRTHDPALFGLVLGGYGLFGAIASVDLRLTRRRKVERLVELRDAEGIAEAFAERIAAGSLYGDFQFDVDERSDRFLRRGVFACYRPVEESRAIAPQQQELSDEDFMRLLFLTHRDKASAFAEYTGYYQSTHGQLYWSDSHQLSTYPIGYHARYDAQVASATPGSEMITELYVPRSRLVRFLDDAAGLLRERRASVIYGTVRWIEADVDTFLPWAREPWACTVLNLHVDHDPPALERAAGAFRDLIDVALAHGGSYFLTYHRFATRAQVEAAHPRFADFLAEKRARDPDRVFRSDWHAHYESWFA